MLKICKLEWKYSWQEIRTVLLSFLVLTLVVGAILGFLGNIPEGATAIQLPGQGVANTVALWSAIIWTVVWLALGVMTAVQILTTVPKKFFSSEGYLANTLPVEHWELLGGKALGMWSFGVSMVFFAGASLLLLFSTAVIFNGKAMQVLQFLGWIRKAVLEELSDALPGTVASGLYYAARLLAAFLLLSAAGVVKLEFVQVAGHQFGKYALPAGFIFMLLLMRLEIALMDISGLGLLIPVLFSIPCFFGSCRLMQKRMYLN